MDLYTAVCIDASGRLCPPVSELSDEATGQSSKDVTSGAPGPSRSQQSVLLANNVC